MEIKINLKRKTGPSKDKVETRKLIGDDHNNPVNINWNIDSVEIKSMSEDEVEFVKKVPSHLRNRLKRRTKKDFMFVKRVPYDPRDPLKRILKRQRLTKQKKMTKVMLCSRKRFPIIQEID